MAMDKHNMGIRIENRSVMSSLHPMTATRNTPPMFPTVNK